MGFVKNKYEIAKLQMKMAVETRHKRNRKNNPCKSSKLRGETLKNHTLFLCLDTTKNIDHTANEASSDFILVCIQLRRFLKGLYVKTGFNAAACS